MPYLVISILFLIVLALFLADGTRRGLNVLGLNLVFRIVSGVLGLVGLLVWQDVEDVSRAWSQVGVMAMIAGTFYWISGWAAIQAVQTGHLGVTWTAKRCAMVLPTLASIIVWKEIPLWPVSSLLVLRLTGVALCVGVAVLLGMDRRQPHPEDHSPSASPAWIAWLVTTVLGYGIYEITLRASATIQAESERGVFMATVFITAMVLSLAAWGIRRPRLGRDELVFGVVAGMCSFVGSGVRPWALRDLPGVIVFPVTAVAVMVLVQIGGEVLFRHRLSLWGRLGIAVAGIAIMLLTVQV